MNVIYTFSDDQISQVHQLYKTVWWAKDRSLSQTKLCVRGSQVCIGLLDDNNQLVGFTRVISDFIYKAIIFDVIVCSKQRGSGLGKQLLKLAKNHELLSNVAHFELYCLPEMEEFYQRLGFSTDVGGIKLMRSINQ